MPKRGLSSVLYLYRIYSERSVDHSANCGTLPEATDTRVQATVLQIANWKLTHSVPRGAAVLKYECLDPLGLAWRCLL